MSQQTATVPVPTTRELATSGQRRPSHFSLESLGAMTFLFVFVIYFLVPFFWLIVSSTKSAGDLFGTFGLWFAPNFNLGSNLQQLFTYNNGIYVRWLLNTLIYAGVGSLLGTLLFQFVSIWNNYFLPLVMLSDQKLFPITVGLQTWNVTTGGANKFLYTLIISGALISSIPLLFGCILLQRFWRGGLGAGSVKG